MTRDLSTLTHHKRRLYVMRAKAFCAAFDFFAEREIAATEHANSSRANYRDYIREECATTGGE